MLEQQKGNYPKGTKGSAVSSLAICLSTVLKLNKKFMWVNISQKENDNGNTTSRLRNIQSDSA